MCWSKPFKLLIDRNSILISKIILHSFQKFLAHIQSPRNCYIQFFIVECQVQTREYIFPHLDFDKSRWKRLKTYLISKFRAIHYCRPLKLLIGENTHTLVAAGRGRSVVWVVVKNNQLFAINESTLESSQRCGALVFWLASQYVIAMMDWV